MLIPNDPRQPLDRLDYSRIVMVIENLKAAGYTSWMSADEVLALGNRDVLRELEAFARHLQTRGY